MSAKKVFITGATGYLGSHLLKEFLTNGWKVFAYVRDKNNLKMLASYVDQVILLDHDDNLNIDVNLIIHAATCYGRNGEDLQEIYESNVLFPIKILNSIRNLENTLFINIDTVLNKFTNNYTISKKHFLEVLLSIKSRFRTVINIRLDHFFGPNDDKTKFSQYVIDKCLANEQTIDLTNGEQIRNFIYIDDVVSAILKVVNHTLMKKNVINFEEYSVASDQNISIKDFALLVHSLTKSKSLLNFGAISYRSKELMKTPVNNDKIKSIGWTPVVPLEEGLIRCIQEREE